MRLTCPIRRREVSRNLSSSLGPRKARWLTYPARGRTGARNLSSQRGTLEARRLGSRSRRGQASIRAGPQPPGSRRGRPRRQRSPRRPSIGRRQPRGHPRSPTAHRLRLGPTPRLWLTPSDSRDRARRAGRSSGLRADSGPEPRTRPKRRGRRRGTPRRRRALTPDPGCPTLARRRARWHRQARLFSPTAQRSPPTAKRP
jgi:hypothetical protein